MQIYSSGSGKRSICCRHVVFCYFFPFLLWTVQPYIFRRECKVIIRFVIIPKSSAFAMSLVTLGLHEPASFGKCACISNKAHSNFSHWLLVRKLVRIQKYRYVWGFKQQKQLSFIFCANLFRTEILYFFMLNCIKLDINSHVVSHGDNGWHKAIRPL